MSGIILQEIILSGNIGLTVMLTGVMSIAIFNSCCTLYKSAKNNSGNQCKEHELKLAQYKSCNGITEQDFKEKIRCIYTVPMTDKFLQYAYQYTKNFYILQYTIRGIISLLFMITVIYYANALLCLFGILGIVLVIGACGFELYTIIKAKYIIDRYNDEVHTRILNIDYLYNDLRNREQEKIHNREPTIHTREQKIFLRQNIFLDTVTIMNIFTHQNHFYGDHVSYVRCKYYSLLTGNTDELNTSRYNFTIRNWIDRILVIARLRGNTSKDYFPDIKGDDFSPRLLKFTFPESAKDRLPKIIIGDHVSALLLAYIINTYNMLCKKAKNKQELNEQELNEQELKELYILKQLFCYGNLRNDYMRLELAIACQLLKNATYLHGDQELNMSDIIGSNLHFADTDRTYQDLCDSDVVLPTKILMAAAAQQQQLFRYIILKKNNCTDIIHENMQELMHNLHT